MSASKLASGEGHTDQMPAGEPCEGGPNPVVHETCNE